MSSSDWELVHVQEGCCTCESVYDAVKLHKTPDAPFNRKNWGRWFTSVPDVQFVPDAVMWKRRSTGQEKMSRGLNLVGFESALDVLHRLGYISEGQFPYPNFFSMSRSDRYAVGRNGTSPTGPKEDRPGLREGWCEEAKSLIALHVQGMVVPPSEVVADLVGRQLRRPGLTEKTLVRQMDRMVGVSYPREALEAYKKKYYPRSKRIFKRVRKTGKPSRSYWTREMDVALIEDAKSIRVGNMGVVNFQRIAVKFRRRNLREVKTHQTVRHRLKHLAYNAHGNELGMTRELWHKLNVTRKRGREKDARQPVMVGVATLNVRGLQVTLTPEQQRQALEEYLTEEAKREAFERFVSSKLN